MKWLKQCPENSVREGEDLKVEHLKQNLDPCAASLCSAHPSLSYSSHPQPSAQHPALSVCSNTVAEWTSGCEGTLGVALESLQGLTDLT